MIKNTKLPMKYLLSCVLLLSFSFGLYAQKTIKEVEKKFDTGKPEIIAYYRDAVSTFNLMKREVFSADGKKIREENFINGKLNGKVFAWKAFDGTPEQELNYIDGKLAGPQKYFFSDGRTKMALNYAAGKMEGRQVEYWFKGGGDTIRSEHNYSAGILHGMQRQWYKDFTPKYNYNFVAGKPDGIQRSFPEGGGQATDERWKNGVFEEVLGAWSPAQPKQVRVYDWISTGSDSLNIVLGRALQKEVRYFETGSIAAITLMSGEAETQEFHLGGKLKAKGKGTVDGKEGKWEFWHQNGQKMSAGEYRAGKKIGLHENWDDKGNLVEEEIWSADGSVRERWRVKFYHLNGKPQSEGALDEKGRRTGLWKTWYVDGSKQREETWELGCAKGGGRPSIKDFSEFDESGKLLRKGNETEQLVYSYFPGGSVQTIQKVVFPKRDACSATPVEVYDGKAMVATKSAATDDPQIVLEQVTLSENGDSLRLDRYNLNGKRAGFQVGWFPDGKKQYEYHFLEGRAQGTIREWHPGGAPMLDFKVASAVGGPAHLVEGKAFSDKGKEYTFNEAEDKEPKKAIVEIDQASFFRKFIEANK
jgi:antitoxin component YwqK of YwqJK toxin-antitoxin module